jgi:hypothetical protein
MRWLDNILKKKAAVPAPIWHGGDTPFCLTNLEGELRQGEIISGLKYYEITPSQEPERLDVHTNALPFVLVATPDCDLFQDFRHGGNKMLEVLLFPLEEVGVAKSRTSGNSNQWRWVKRNQVSQFYMLTKVPIEHDALGMGIPELVVDFKRYFTLPPAEIYRQCRLAQGGAARRCRLNDIWREDFRQRALSYMGRIGVPSDDDNV